MKRIMSLLLVIAMIMSSLTLLISCSEEGEGKKPSGVFNDNVSSDGGDGDIFAERAAISDELETKDFGGRKFRIASHKDTEFCIDEELINKGDLIRDAMASRDEAVENRFNVDVTVAYQGTYEEVTEWVSKTVLSGADEFELFSSHSASAGGLVLKNLFLNWYDIPNVDFSKPWWSSCCSDELTYDGKCILAVSDFNYSAIWGARCLIFNKNLANSYDLGNLYETVLDGDWTFDLFTEMVKDIYIDEDGDGNKSDGDFFGFAQSHEYQCATSAWLWAFDNPTMAKNADGVPEIAIKTEKINNIVSSLYDLVYNTNGVHYRPDNEPGQGMDIFLAKRAVFTVACVGSPVNEDLRNFDDEYGLLPLPKWDENQKDYLTMTDGEHTVMAVPKTVKDTEFVGTITEALSAESYKKVIPTLYEIALKTRYLRDNESKEVLDIVLDGRVYDFGYIYGGFEGFGFTIGALLMEANPNFESFYTKKFKTARLHYKKIIRVFDKLD